MGSGLYHPADPQAAERELDDQSFALDHFGAKLFKIAGNFQTKAGQALAETRTRTMQDFVRALLDEIGGQPDDIRGDRDATVSAGFADGHDDLSP
jgi:uncharacterized protein